MVYFLFLILIQDIDKVKEQMSNYEATPRERLIDSKTMLPLVGGDVPQSNSRYGYKHNQ